mmetsp:Transcript_87708/g.248599  ORF Transcript_87708/g.248599 Transcript_87708/m.248599 type:complete len:187 (-) Transcript_87708:249-809(-)|eukprot:CAMPEP_0179273368 /NCGR_PEP_ID=MMETSP0797-20121207/32977_1 /TAXON_ID=47934 /ORGANISM="Dinophysis acuminata, Strain DAEP01" /LENGTH=186 /DNA_ID=CAMNT_0020981793 /DNA_START=39 /DNA_END=599 /DNA_ORIENTATION=-
MAQNFVKSDRFLRRSFQKESEVYNRRGWVPNPGERDPGEFVAGQTVRIRGLNRRSELNDLEACVLSHTKDDSGRLTVQITGSGRWSDAPYRYRVNPLHLEHSLSATGRPSAPTPLPTAAHEMGASSAVSTATPEVLCVPHPLRATMSTPVLPSLPESFRLTANEPHKHFPSGRGYLRKKDGGFFTS